jgi:hypothetical protein
MRAAAEPVGDGERLLGESHITANAVDEYYARKFEVLDVLAGEGVGPGDQIEIARLSSVVDVTDANTGTTTRHRTVGGGYPGPLEGDAFIFGLSQDFPGASSGAWGLVSGAHGMILFAGDPGELEVAPPRTGYDGQLQRVLTGLSKDEVEARFR